MIGDIDYRVWLLLLGIVLCVQNYTFYIKSVFKGTFKPHMFSWGIWSLLSAIAFAAQWSKDAGPGMWQTAIMTAGTTLIMIVAYFKGDRNYTRSDWAALTFALAAIPLWLATNDPVWSVILITMIDVVACWPTVRKSWLRPHQESARIFFICGVICALGFFALSVVTVTTGLYQGAIALINFMLCALILIRRRFIAETIQ